MTPLSDTHIRAFRRFDELSVKESLGTASASEIAKLERYDRLLFRPSTEACSRHFRIQWDLRQSIKAYKRHMRTMTTQWTGLYDGAKTLNARRIRVSE